MTDDMKELIKNTLIMLAITLIAGGILGVVYQVTKEPIAKMEERTRSEACKEVFKDAESFSESVIDVLSMTKEFEEKEIAGVELTKKFDALASDGSKLGVVYEVTSHEGYGGDIVWYIGIQNDGTTNGISITSISETAGLGMRAEEVLVPQFTDKTAASFKLMKGNASKDDEIDAISSATVTSKAIIGGVNAALVYFNANDAENDGGDSDE